MSIKKILTSILLTLSLFFYFEVAGQNLSQKLSNHLKEYEVNFDKMMRYRGMSYNSEEPTSEILYEIIKSYDDSTGILFYHFSNDTLHVWLLTLRDGFYNIDNKTPNYFYTKTTEQKMLELEQDFRSLIEEGSIGSLRGAIPENKNAATKETNSIIKELSCLLFPDEIGTGLKMLNKLLIIPTLNISTIPIYILNPMRTDEMLIENYTISFVHGIQHLLNLHWQSEPLLKFRNLEYNLIGFSNFSNCEQFEDLPGVEKELKAARESIDHANQIIVDTFENNGYRLKKPIVTFNLNDTSVVNQIEKSSSINKQTNRILYLATHASSNPNNPLDSNFLITNTCETINERTLQFMDHSEVLLVILSACQTGQGKTMNTGTLSVGRAFLKGNARNVISSLWSVDDQATAEFMELFIQEITDFRIDSIKDLGDYGDTAFDMVFYPAHQLRQAMLKFRKVDPNPNHWSAFISTGSPIKGFVISY